MASLSRLRRLLPWLSLSLAGGPAAAQSSPPRLDATLHGGLSDAGGAREAGVRFAELALEPAPGSRAWLQYDDSLSLDSSALSRAGTRAPSFWLGGLLWYGSAATRLEAGYRRLPGGVDEGLVRGEQVLGLDGGLFLKLGGLLGARSDRRLESVLHAGASIPAGARLRLEPTVFWGRTGVAGEQELRGLLAAEASAGGLRFAAGASAGWAFRPDPAARGALFGAFARVFVPIGDRLEGQLLASREWPAGSGPLTVLSAGLAARLGGRP